MTAEIRVNQIKSRSGINTLDFTGNGFSFLTNVGFGTTNATSGLTVEGTALITGVSTFSNDVNIGVGGTTAFFDVSTGNVGIGTDNPIRELVVYKPTADAHLSLIASQSQQAIVLFGDTDSDAAGQIRYDNTDDSMSFRVNGPERLRITSTGDVVLAAGQTVGSSAGIVTYFGDGSNLTGIAAGGSGTFDTGITTSIIVPVTAGIGTNDDTNRDVFVGPGIAYSFPSTASTQYVIESIHVVNKSGGNLYLSGRHDINGGANVPIANRVIVPYNGAVELLEQPHVANLSDVIRLQALTGTGSSATGASNGLDAFITYSAKSDSTDYIGVAQTITSTDQEFFEVASNPCVVQSINLVNYSNNIDVDVSISIFSGGTTGGIATTGIRRGYLAYNITVPRNSTIELCEKPKRLESNQALLITASSNNSVGVTLAGKYITS